MNVSGKKVLLTGAGGFIGSHLVEELVRSGASVRAFLHYNSRGDEGNLRHLASEIRRAIEIVFGDLHDSDAVEKAVKGASAVFHLGALIAIPYSYVHPSSYVQTNVIGTTNILNSALREECERVIVTSTSEVYGTAVSTPMNEDHRLHPQSPYAASKASADHLARSYAHSFGLPVVLVRPFNTFGPRQSLRAVIPSIVAQALRGNTVEVGAVWPTRDFNYVKDIARGFVLAARADDVEGEVFNLGTGIETSISEVVETVADILNIEILLHSSTDRMRPEKSEVGRLIADSSKAAMALGWKPQNSFRRAIEQTVEWYETHEQTLAHVQAL